MKKIFLNNFLFLCWNYFNLIYIILKKILIFKFLMFAFLNYFSLLKILINKFCFYYSRSKNFFWFKGNFSKNFQILNFFYIDCDMDTIIFYIFQYNNLTCHLNYTFCNINKINF